MAFYIPDAKIQEVRERVDILALAARQGIELKRAGRSFKGRCPFHQERTPSFYVWPDDKSFHCFGCQAHGDAITFMQRLWGKSFTDTVRELASELGIDIQADADPASRERSQVKEATDFAAAFFTKNLMDRSLGANALAYLRGRGLSDATIRTFSLGFAPAEWGLLAQALQGQGLIAHGERAGLIAPRASGKGYYDTFRGRIIIPIRSPEGRTIAFGGRLLGEEEGPKYLNSKENRLYNKSETLYGMDLARDTIRRTHRAVLCEGYFDCIALHQAGIGEALALCSTALTVGHLSLLARLEVSDIVLLLDGDAAGRAAVERLAPVILAQGASSRVACLPSGEDPDTFARKFGAQAIQALISAAQPLSRHLLEMTLPDGIAATFEAKMSAIKRLSPLVSAAPVGMRRTSIIEAIASHFGWQASQVAGELQKRPSTPAAQPPRRSPRATTSGGPDVLECTYAACVVLRPDLASRDNQRAADDLKHPGIRMLVDAIQSGIPPADALFDCPEDLKAQIDQAQQAHVPRDAAAQESAFEQLCMNLKRRTLKARSIANARLAKCAVGGASDLTQESRDLLEEQASLGPAMVAIDRERGGASS